MSGTVSVRERRAIDTLGELNVVVTAKQGLSICPVTSSIVSMITDTFAHYVETRCGELFKLKRKVLFSELAKRVGWEDAFARNTAIKTFGVEFNKVSNNVVAHIETRNPIGRQGLHALNEDDYKLKFTMTWDGRLIA